MKAQGKAGIAGVPPVHPTQYQTLHYFTIKKRSYQAKIVSKEINP
jgi:hypothetical protein